MICTIATKTIVQCDICGCIADAKAVEARYNEVDYDIPSDWWKSKWNPKIHLCPTCKRKFDSADKEY